MFESPLCVDLGGNVILVHIALRVSTSENVSKLLNEYTWDRYKRKKERERKRKKKEKE